MDIENKLCYCVSKAYVKCFFCCKYLCHDHFFLSEIKTSNDYSWVPNIFKCITCFDCSKKYL